MIKLKTRQYSSRDFKEGEYVRIYLSNGPLRFNVKEGEVRNPNKAKPASGNALELLVKKEGVLLKSEKGSIAIENEYGFWIKGNLSMQSVKKVQRQSYVYRRIRGKENI